MADRTQPPKGASDGSTDAESYDTSRRAFLGAAAALSATIASSGTATATEEKSDEGDTRPRVDVSHGDYGSSRASVEAGEPVRGFLDLAEFDDEDSSIKVNGYHYDDAEPNAVEIHAGVGPASLTLDCSPERALELAEELTLAAEHAWGDVE